jgi:hypothetical protein
MTVHKSTNTILIFVTIIFIVGIFMKWLFSVHWLLIAAGWYGVNGILHDIFVIKGHKGSYDRELLRLLMDGHVLLFSALLLGAAWWMLRSGIAAGAVIGVITALCMLVYCAMIFPFLRSFGTITITIFMAIACIGIYRRLS